MSLETRFAHVLASALLCCALGATDAEAKSRGLTFHTYTKSHPSGKIYTGRTSGIGKPAKILQKRDAGHHMNDKGYSPARLDKSSTNQAAIRGREQQLIDKHKTEGRSGNAINGISPKNKKRDHYLAEAENEFGKP